jgi:hypothetical protein
VHSLLASVLPSILPSSVPSPSPSPSSSSIANELKCASTLSHTSAEPLRDGHGDANALGYSHVSVEPLRDGHADGQAAHCRTIASSSCGTAVPRGTPCAPHRSLGLDEFLPADHSRLPRRLLCTELG